MDTITDLHESMETFYSRFDLLPPTKLAVARKLKEEVNELIIAMHGGDQDEIMGEGGDVIAVVVGAFIACGLDEAHIISAIYRTIYKNDQKTHKTHKLENGTINRLKGS